MSSADLWEDGFPHGTTEGYDRGCRGGACPGTDAWGLSCKLAKTMSRGDYQYQKLAKTGAGPAEIAEQLGLIPTAPTAAPAKAKSAPKAKAAPAPKPTAEAPDVTTNRNEADTTAPDPDATSPIDDSTALAADPQIETPAPRADAHTPRQIREWARTKGYDVAAKGKLPQHIVDHFWEAHGLLTTTDQPPVNLPDTSETAEPADEPTPAPAPDQLAVASAAAEPRTDTTPAVGTLRVDGTLTAGLAEIREELDTTIDKLKHSRPDWATVNLTNERDRARDLACRLEQELARSEETRIREATNMAHAIQALTEQLGHAQAAHATADDSLAFALTQWGTARTEADALREQNEALKADNHALLDWKRELQANITNRIRKDPIVINAAHAAATTARPNTTRRSWLRR